MNEKYTSLGLMSGTSGDGVDASVINSNGIDEYTEITNKYFEYNKEIYQSIHSTKEKIFNINDLKKYLMILKNSREKLLYFMPKL